MSLNCLNRLIVNPSKVGKRTILLWRAFWSTESIHGWKEKELIFLKGIPADRQTRSDLEAEHFSTGEYRSQMSGGLSCLLPWYVWPAPADESPAESVSSWRVRRRVRPRQSPTWPLRNWDWEDWGGTERGRSDGSLSLSSPRQICIIERKWGCLTMLMENEPMSVCALCLYFVYYLKSSSRQQTSSEAPCGNIARDEVQSIQSEAGTFGQHKNRNRNWLFVLRFCSHWHWKSLLKFPAFPRKLDVDDFYILNVRSLLYKITVPPRMFDCCELWKFHPNYICCCNVTATVTTLHSKTYIGIF